MLIKATFKGQDGSLGFVYGKEYIIIVKGLKIINAANTKQVCQYKNIETFLNNWDNVQRQYTS